MAWSVHNLRIPKDLSTDKIQFYTSMPLELSGILNYEIWETHIKNINRILVKYEEPSNYNLLKYFCVIPLLLKNDSFKAELKTYVRKMNKELSSYGIKIANLEDSGYSELEITYFKE